MPDSVFSPDFQQTLDSARHTITKTISVNGSEVEVASPFPSPADWRDKWIYFLMVDRFNNSTRSPREDFDALVGGFQGGTFEGVRQQLGYLKTLGVGTIWLTPVLKNCQYLRDTFHGYGIQDFLEIEPRLASNQADPEGELKTLIDEAHAHGIYVILDIVLNHTGDVFAYIREDGSVVNAANYNSQGYPINWRDAQGHPNPQWSQSPADNDPLYTRDAAVWPKELLHNELFRRKGKGGEQGGDFESLKELVTAKKEVRNTLIRAHQYLIAKFDVDGFRIDTLKYIEKDFARIFGNAMREFALSIGKKNFFTFGEVYDDEHKIAQFIGRQTTESSDIVGVDAALDFPLFYKLPGVCKGLASPSEVVDVFQLRKKVQQDIISSHGDASRFFVSFLDNHDMKNRLFHRDSSDPDRFVDQVTLAIGCLFSLQGIPCLYYGTEQGLSGAGNSDRAVREALWGKPSGFDAGNRFYKEIARLSELRDHQPALRYGRQYFRPISGNGTHFGISVFNAGVLAFSRILNDKELIIIANCNTQDSRSIFVIVDHALNQDDSTYEVLFSNKSNPTHPGPVHERHGVSVTEVNGNISSGPVRALQVTVKPMEIQFLGS